MARRSRGIPVVEVASDLRLSPGELRRRLGKAGMLRHVLPDDSIPPAMVNNIAEAVRDQGPPPEPSGPGLDLDQLMASTGVKPMKGRGQASRSPRPRDPKAQKAAVGKQQSSVPRSELESRLQRAKAANLQLAERLRQAESALETLRAEHAREQAARVQAQEAVQTLQASLQGESAEAPLTELLESRGLIGEDERNAAVRALISVRRWDAIATTLKPLNPQAAQRAMALHVVLACTRGDCEVPKGMGLVQVAPGRCEVCAGEGRKRHLRRLGDAFLLHGLRRIALVGGPAGYRRMIRESLDERIQIVTGQGPDAVDLAEVQVMLVWGEPPEGEQPVPVLSVKARGLVDFIAGVRSQLAAGMA